MPRSSLILFLSCLIGILTLFSEAPQPADTLRDNNYPLSLPNAEAPLNAAHRSIVLQLSHPGASSDAPMDCKLFQALGQDGLPVEYYMNVDSVFCREGDCAIVSVRLFWDSLGFYNRYELAPGITLEKAEGKPFLEEDYAKLHKILSDRDSPYRSVNINAIILDKKVDGLSGATITLDDADTVKGAAWTCYTLWHWANGDIFQEIRDRTGKACTLPDILAYLSREDSESKAFALQELIERRAYDRETVDFIREQGSPEESDLTKLILQYMEGAPDAVYCSLMDSLFESGTSKQRTLYLDSFLDNTSTPTREFMDRFSRYLPELESYYEVHLFLDLMDSRNHHSPEVVRQALPLLEKDSFLIARKAFWFLGSQSLSDEQELRLEAFRDQFADRL